MNPLALRLNEAGGKEESQLAMSTQGLQQTQRLAQGQILTPQLRQSLRILQLASTELHQEIAKEIVANPLLEEIPPEELPTSDSSPLSLGDLAPAQENSLGESDASGDVDDLEAYALASDRPERDNIANEEDFEETLRKIGDDWQDDTHAAHSEEQPFSEDDGERRQRIFDSAVAQGSLEETLLTQAALATHDQDVLKALEHLVGELDERGFMSTDIGTLCLQHGLSRSTFLDAWEILKSMEPIGIGAADLRECLLIQLLHGNKRRTLATLLVDKFFPLLLKQHFREIAQKLGTSPEEVREAALSLASLDPAPARRFLARDENRVITIDVIVHRNADDTGWDVTMNDAHIPRLRLNQTYKSLLALSSLKAGERGYISEKIRDGRFLIGAIEQRQQTLERIARLILKYQGDFFNEGISKLRPLTMAQFATELGLHETTVGRAVANKGMSTPHGTFELRFFFTKGVTTDSGEALANTSIREVLADIIVREPPGKPFSDQALVLELSKRGIHIARRTIATYREALSIPPAHLRRKN